MPERKLSYGENLEKTRKLHNRRVAQHPTFEDSRTKYDRPVRVSRRSDLPHPLQCSKCAYIATSRMKLNDHWELEH